ncbi:PP0621 family protein [Limnobacter parvus]|uniref:PP0621 family protein n=1 Tax=Limnobacter parvus TaxID=2939690 RepID=A0ABT1XJ45_9BURK|nr:PP0621 family protein [Limnobacter parvus]MCR2746119.1 PP0621 family protein [Limnobacter parvus]
MGRILFFLGLALVAWMIFKSWQRKQLDEKPSDKPKQKSSLGRKSQEEIMPCQHCGAYSPMSEGVLMQGRFYCGMEHAKAAGEKVH